MLDVGHKKTVYLPSGNWVTIREQNGADDDVLSNPTKLIYAFSEFISGIVLDSSFPSKILTEEQVNLLPTNDKYAILYHSRIHSLGNMVYFDYDWGNQGGKIEYSQDLNEYLLDYKNPPVEEEIKAKPNAIPYIPNEIELEFTTTYGKKLKFNRLNTHGENYIMTLGKEKLTKNVDLFARNMEMEVDGRWVKIENFKLFPAKEMIEIRNYVTIADPLFQGMCEIQNYAGEKQEIHLMATQDFFYPAGI